MMGLKLELLLTIRSSKQPILTTELIRKHRGKLNNPRSRVWHELNSLERNRLVRKHSASPFGTKWVATVDDGKPKAK